MGRIFSLICFVVLGISNIAQAGVDSSCGGLLAVGQSPNIVKNSQRLQTPDAELSYRLLRTPKYIKTIARPGDRVVLGLTPEFHRLPWTLLSPEGQNQLRNALQTVNPREALGAIAEKFGIATEEAVKLLGIDGEGLIREMIQARNQNNWDEVIRIYETQLIGPWQKVVEARLQAALAYGRRNQGGDRDMAIRITDDVIANSKGKMILSEAYGIRGRILKDLYDETKVERYIKESIRAYLRGYDSNPIDFYPGVAGLNLMLRKLDITSPQVQRLVGRLLETIQLVKARLDSTGAPPDFWFLATALRLHVLKSEWNNVALIMPDVIASSGGRQNLETTLEDYRSLLVATEDKMPLEFNRQLRSLIDLFEFSISIPTDKLPLGSVSPSYVTSREFPKMEGVYDVTPFNVKNEISATGIEDELLALKKFGDVQIESFHKLLQKQKVPGRSKPVLLAPTGPYKSVIQVVSEQLDMIPWWDAHALVGLESKPENAEQFLRKTLAEGRHLYLLVPRNFRGTHADSYTLSEFEILKKLFPQFNSQIHFVFGFEHVYPLDFKNRLSQKEVSQNYAINVTRYFTNRFSDWLTALRNEVKAYRLGSDFNTSLYPVIYDQVLSQLSYHRHLRSLHSAHSPRAQGASGVIHMIDAGGGTGLVTRQLMQDDPHRNIEIFDLSQAMTRVAKVRGVPEDRIHISSITKFVRKNGQPVPSSSIDGVVCNNVIYLLTKDQVQEFLSESFRVLKPGGKLNLSSMLDASIETHRAFLNAAVAETKEHEDSGLVPRGGSQILMTANTDLIKQAPSLFSFDEISDLAVGAGFKVKFQSLTYGGAGFFVELQKP